jgi:hypothetical protein
MTDEVVDGRKLLVNDVFRIVMALAKQSPIYHPSNVPGRASPHSCHRTADKLEAILLIKFGVKMKSRFRIYRGDAR